MTVGDYYYFSNYLKGLEEYYEKHVKIHSYRELSGICKEIETIKNMLNTKNN